MLFSFEALVTIVWLMSITNQKAFFFVVVFFILLIQHVLFLYQHHIHPPSILHMSQ